MMTMTMDELLNMLMMTVICDSNCVGDHPEFCTNRQCNVNEDEEGKKTTSPTCVHPHPYLIWKLVFSEF